MYGKNWGTVFVKDQPNALPIDLVRIASQQPPKPTVRQYFGIVLSLRTSAQ